MTPSEFVVEIRKMHEPYIPELVSICSDDSDDPTPGQWRDATIEDKSKSLHWWCDGCNTLAKNCRIQHLLILVEA